MKKLTVLLLMTMFSALQSFAQPFLYDPAVVQDIRITFTQPNWDYQMDTAAVGSEGFIIAQLVTINGVAYDSVGVKYKGNSSFNVNNMKNPLHIELNYIKGNADYQGYTDLKLSNGFKDPSFVREPLSYEILRQYMHAPLA
ncbi:MAG: CotH kinase family protein, partial [Bacteroidota bacterium]